MDSSGDRMPLTDANKRSPRVYTNLQNIDLDSVTFANVQDTGNPIAIEELNEDEMRRLVLVNLARLVCAGEWNGLLTAGGGLESVLSALDIASTEIGGDGTWDNYPLSVNAGGQTATGIGSPQSPYYFPFVVTKAGSIDEIKCYIGSADAGKNVLVGIYDEAGGVPVNLLSTTTLDVGSTGAASASPDATTTFAVGTQYFVAFVEDSSSNTASFYGSSGNGSSCQFPVADAGLFDGGNSFYKTGGASRSLDDPVDPDTIDSIVTNIPRFWFTYA